MTSENDILKTNEFLRRRKLRLQQVREQSKDIAKKIRQRAKVEKLRHVIDIDSKKEKEYLECQEKLVKRLELLYSKNLQNVGASHKHAVEVSESGVEEKVDLSKVRGKEAVAELRKQRQEKLDEQKKLLDRKLQAREAANEISREKSSMIAKNLTKQTKKADQPPNKSVCNSDNINDKNENKDTQKSNPDVTKTDMATQWESGELLNEWVPNVPELLLPKESAADETVENTEKSDKNKRLNLFALSDEMPSSLRGGLSTIPEQLVTLKPSLTHVSEYLQNRNLRLRQFEPVKKPDDLQSIKQTILHTRASRTDGSVFDSICHVLDEQVIPVPSWHAERNFSCNCQIKTNPYFSYHFSKFPVNNLHGKLWSNQKNFHLKNIPGLSSRINKLDHGKNPGNKDKSFRSNDPEVTRKKSISVYNHNTRDIKDVPYGKEQFVSHERRSKEDAYSQALQETASASDMEKDKLHKKQQDMRNKIAVTKQNVDKEYRDTLAFLNSLSKDKDVSHKTYVDDQRRQIQNDRRQRQMQQEFKKIEKDCHKQNCKHNKRKLTVLDKSRSKSKSPVNIDEQQRRHFEYSWMPVPESEDNFAIHNLPTTTKIKSGHTVKFSEPNSYHEYRSRHKHTPPTKDVNDDRHSKKIVETVIVHQNNNEDESVPVSETSSVENMSLESDENELNVGSKLRDADRIIIYKILDSKNKTTKKHRKAESTINKGKSVMSVDHHSKNTKLVNLENKCDDTVQKVGSFEQLREGVYKGVSSNGDNITSIDIQDDEEKVENQTRSKDKSLQSCACGKAPSNVTNKDVQNEGGDNTSRSRKLNINCNCGKKVQDNNLLPQPSETTTATSFKTAPNDKSNVTPDAGFLKLIDEGGHETGKFYIGASGFIKDDNYEVVIQLRKKEGEKSNYQESRDALIPNVVTEKHGVTELENKKSTVVGEESDRLSENFEENLVNLPNSITNVETSKVGDSNIDEVHINKKQSLSKEKSENNFSESIEKPQSKNTCEKAVHTSFNDSYAIPINLPKSEPLPRPATSTYTQTSFNSSIQRPGFLHMTSSTSTAYMSPPELVLPNFLKNDYVMTQEELFESENSVDQTDPQYEVIKDNKEYDKCSCKRCIHLKETSVISLNLKRKATSTPPNTARSSHQCRVTNKTKNEKRKCKCHKCRCNSETKICHKTHKKRTKSCDSSTTKDYLYENKHMKVQSSKQKSSNKSKDDCTINPTVKNYVNKLLALNKEGLKAVEIIYQECSTASTPGSSIINIPTNKQQSNKSVDNKISLEQIKNILKQKILEKDFNQLDKFLKPTYVKNSESQTEKVPKLLIKFPKKKSVHKVKSLNISRQLLHKKKFDTHRSNVNKSKICTSTSSSTREENKVTCTNTKTIGSKSASKETSIGNSEYKNSTSSDIAEPTNKKRYNKVVKNLTRPVNSDHSTALDSQKIKPNICNQNNNLNLYSRGAKTTATSSDSEVPSVVLRHITAPLSPNNISTQTNGTIDVEQNFMKVAEDKLQNMEKIADLTEKCTKRLSNLAKVLEEVRRNKSLVYSQISTSDSASESENKSDKNDREKVPSSGQDMPPSYKLLKEDTNKQLFSSLTIPTNLDEKKLSVKDKTQFIPFLIDIPKPTAFKIPLNDENISMNDKTTPIKNLTTESAGVKVRGRPPPALSRINLKNGSEINVTPHELSTVLEVDSPMSFKLKNQSSRPETKLDVPEKIQISNANEKEMIYVSPELKENRIDPDLLQCNVTAPKVQSKVLSTDSSDESKIQMIDLKQFNNIMLKPFITLQEYAKQCNIGLEDGSNVEDAMKGEPINEDLSSLHSDGSLPDVIAELLKRNIISEPFKFDTGSNGNSNSLSSESSLSVLALSKSTKKKSGILLKNKENVADTSETLSISSNPDLENAFQKLGMGWASSTLKKTKERLALSSSTNTSSSSLTQFKIKPFSQVMPTLATDSTSSLLNNSNDERKKPNSPSRNTKNNHKNVVQQTSLTNSMTVKEFLTNELAKKITFSNNSARKDVDEQFVSLYETNIPDELKNTNIGIQDDGDQSTIASNNVRARTSTPVQIFKSTTYKSTSSSNTSNGLFSNADDLSSVKGTSNSMRNHSTSDKDDLTIPNYSLKTRKDLSDFSKSD